MSAEREMTLAEWVKKLPAIHSARKEFCAMRATIAQQAEVIGLSEDSRLMDEYIKLENDHKRQAETIQRQAAVIDLAEKEQS